MIRALFLTLGQLGDPAIVRVLIKSLLLTALIFAIFGAASWWVAQWALDRFIGWHDGGIAGLIALLLTLLSLWLAYRAIAVAVIQLFGDEVVRAIERRHYPAAVASERRVPMAMAIRLGLVSAARALVVNLVLLPVYLALLITGVGTPLLFLAVNAWLLGHDLADLAGARHLDRAGLARWKRENRAARFALGLVAATLLTVPIVNLLAPVIGAGMAAHLFHARRTR